jgi:hypothetical protein
MILYGENVSTEGLRMLLTLGLQMMVVAAIFQLPQLEPINRQPLSVCEVLQDLKTYRGQIIQIRGRWTGDSLEGDCPTSLKTGDYEWPSAVVLTQPNSSIVESEEPAKWKADMPAYRRALRELERRSQDSVVATFVGRLDARDRLEVLTNNVPQPVPVGYGHLGTYPARLVIITVKEVVAQRRR